MMRTRQYKSINYSHNRYNPLKDEWVLVCPHRSERPWMGQIEKIEQKITEQESMLKNPLSSGGTRSNGHMNPQYTSTYVFDNDFPALVDNMDDEISSEDDTENLLFRIKPAKGRCRVMCFHPKSNTSLPLMSVKEIASVIDTWVIEFQKLGSTYSWVQIFENKGAMMGCSNPHPHCQIWASRFLPNEGTKKDQTQREYYRQHRQPMLWDYVQEEIKEEQQQQERIIIKNNHWVVLVPFWAIWPFETMILPHHRQIRRLDEINDEEKQSLASIMKNLLIKYDNLFQTSFPYSMGWHGAPTGPYLKEDMSHWILHAVYYPPLLRSATIKKFMVGYEMTAQAQRDITPEKAAEIIRQASDQHYLEI